MRVIEMAGIGPIPWTGMVLADLGAEVVRIDRIGPPTLGDIVGPDPTGRGRRSLALDLKQPEATEIVLRLLDSADILIEGFRPGVMERLGLGPQVCLERRPRLVFGRMTGWGQEGPRARTAGHDLNYLSVTGVLAAIGTEGQSIPPLNLIGDYGGGAMLLLVGILAAAWAVRGGAPGQVIDAAMVDGVALLASLVHGLMANGNWTEKRQSNLLDGGAPFYRTYQTSDGEQVAVGALEPQFFAEMLRGLGLSSDDLPSQYDRAAWPLLADAIAERFALGTRDHWTSVFADTDACVSPVLRWSEADSDPHVGERGIVIDGNGMRQAAPAPRFSATPLVPPRPLVSAGSDTRSILSELGYDEGAIVMLLANKVAATSQTP
jgi:alpha-methylacyl-CoA racemase